MPKDIYRRCNGKIFVGEPIGTSNAWNVSLMDAVDDKDVVQLNLNDSDSGYVLY